MSTKPECDICGRTEGSEVDRCGEHDGVPLGPIETCEICGRHTCPDCLHEAACCFVEYEEHHADPNWAPPGWVRSEASVGHGAIEYVRV